MENVNVILSLLGFLGLGSAAIHYAGCRKVQARAKAKVFENENRHKGGEGL